MADRIDATKVSSCLGAKISSIKKRQTPGRDGHRPVPSPWLLNASPPGWPFRPSGRSAAGSVRAAAREPMAGTFPGKSAQKKISPGGLLAWTPTEGLWAAWRPLGVFPAVLTQCGCRRTSADILLLSLLLSTWKQQKPRFLAVFEVGTGGGTRTPTPLARCQAPSTSP